MPDDAKSDAGEGGAPEKKGSMFGRSPFGGSDDKDTAGAPAPGDDATGTGASGTADAEAADATGTAVAIRTEGKLSPTEKQVARKHDQLSGMLSKLRDALDSLPVIESFSKSANESPKPGEVNKILKRFGEVYAEALDAKEGHRSTLLSDRVKHARTLGELIAEDESVDLEAAIKAMRNGGSIEDALRAAFAN